MTNKAGCVLFASLKTTKIGSQKCGFLCNWKHPIEWWRLVVSFFMSFWVYLFPTAHKAWNQELWADCFASKHYEGGVHWSRVGSNWILRQCKSGAWKKESNDEALKCWNLEQILDAERFGEPKPPQLTMNDLLSDLEGGKGSVEDGVVHIYYFFKFGIK